MKIEQIDKTFQALKVQMEKDIAAIDKHLATVDNKAMSKGGKFYFTAKQANINPAQVLAKVCGIYHIVKPIFQLVATYFIFLPKKWRDKIKSYTELMDFLCPGEIPE